MILFLSTNAELAAQIVEQVREFVQTCGFSYKGTPDRFVWSRGTCFGRRADKHSAAGRPRDVQGQVRRPQSRLPGGRRVTLGQYICPWAEVLTD